MRVFLYSPVHFEQWDWSNSTEKGIGGSETCHVEVCWRLARRGHQVVSHAPLPQETPTGSQWRGVEWRSLDQVNYDEPGLWIIFRCPAELDNFQKRDDQTIWLMCQDEDYPGQWNDERIAKIDRVLALSRVHAQCLAKDHPGLSTKIYQTSNGLKMDLVREVEREDPPVRNPKRIMYASSPDRGLIPLLKIFRRAREFEPDLELHCYYGLDNIEKLIKFRPQFGHYKKLVDDLKKALDQPNVFWHGRVSQRELYKNWLQSGIWAYPTGFSETSCITCMEAQALGAVPITQPYWALGENVGHGIFIYGDPTFDALIQSRYVGEILRLARQPTLQEQIRKEMMEWARWCFNWERTIDTWETWMLKLPVKAITTQGTFQVKHMKGRTLNVGCANDIVGLREIGAINLDINQVDPTTGATNSVDVIADARHLPFHGEFDTVILGDILEHMQDKDAVAALVSARGALKEGGQIIITTPEDRRPPTNDKLYTPGITAWHQTIVTKDRLRNWLMAAGLKAALWQDLDYGFFAGNGVIAEAANVDG